MTNDYSELVERLGDHFADCPPKSGEKSFTRPLLNEAATAITTLQAERDSAWNDAIEAAAVEAEAWFPANTASANPAIGVVAAIRTLKR